MTYILLLCKLLLCFLRPVVEIYFAVCVFARVEEGWKKLIGYKSLILDFYKTALKTLFLLPPIPTFYVTLYKHFRESFYSLCITSLLKEIYSENNYVWEHFLGERETLLSPLNFRGDTVRNRFPPSENKGGREYWENIWDYYFRVLTDPL